MENNKKISVLISVFNQEKYIGRCIRSLLSQTLKDDLYEIIVVNDGSTDKTPYALKLFTDPNKSLVKVINNDKNIGLPASINKAIHSSKSEYFVRVDSDDWVSKDFLKIMYTFLEKNTYMDAIACDYVVTDEKEEAIERRNCLLNPIACGIMFRKIQIVDIGYYDENFLYQEDKELRIRFEKKYKIHRLELPLYRYRRHNSNMTNNQEYLDQFNNKLIEKHGIKIKK